MLKHVQARMKELEAMDALANRIGLDAVNALLDRTAAVVPLQQLSLPFSGVVYGSEGKAVTIHLTTCCLDKPTSRQKLR